MKTRTFLTHWRGRIARIAAGQPRAARLLEEVLLRDGGHGRGGRRAASTARPACGGRFGGAGREVADRGEVSVMRTPMVSARTDIPPHLARAATLAACVRPGSCAGSPSRSVLARPRARRAARPARSQTRRRRPRRAPTADRSPAGRRGEPVRARLRERSRRPRVRPRRRPACSSRVDQTNNVTVVLTAPSAADLATFYRRTAVGNGFTVTGRRPGDHDADVQRVRLDRDVHRRPPGLRAAAPPGFLSPDRPGPRSRGAGARPGPCTVARRGRRTPPRRRGPAPP